MNQLPITLILICGLFSCSAIGKTDHNSVSEPLSVIGSVVRMDPRLDDIVPQGAELEILATGHQWTEGPVWVPALEAILYSDIPNNAIYRWS